MGGGVAETAVREDGLATETRSPPGNPFPSPHSLRNRAGRALWQVVWALLFRPSPRIFHRWRRMLLRFFGARIGFGAHIHPSVRVWAPWNLTMGEHSCLGPFVDCYNAAEVELGEFCTVSQYSHLCAATHDYTDLRMPVVAKPIRLGAWAWICAGAFIGPGVIVGEGAVVGARSVVTGDIEPWTVVAGNPARVLKARVLRYESAQPCGSHPYEERRA